MTPPTPRAWRRLTKADLYLQTAQQAEKILELMDNYDDLLHSHEDLNQRLGEALNEVLYWQQRATQAEQRLPDRLRLVGPEESA